MKVFFDTSALVKYFHEEKGTATVTDLIANPENEVFISELAKLEFLSALHRRYRRDEIEDCDLKQAITAFDNECSSFHVEPISRLIMQEARKFIQQYGKEHGLRTLDAIYLATFYLLKDDGWLFVASDDNLIQITVEELEVEVLNPLDLHAGTAPAEG